jgi:two-component sensor histidine kinase
VPFDTYARGLARSVFHAMEVASARVDLVVEMDPVPLPVDKAIPCALILNELITNALKHAFPDPRSGTLRVELRRSGENELTLTVSDDGVGMPSGLEPKRSQSLGMQLVSTLVEQLEGRLELARDGGTTVSVTFALEATS